jgi:hypothetical protein
MKILSQTAILLTSLLFLIGCLKVDKTPAAKLVEIIVQKEEIAVQPAKVAVQQEAPAETPHINIISTKKHLEEFFRLVSEGNDFKNEIVKLDANIMLNDTTAWKKWEKNPPASSWVPIGTKEKKFRGTFDGDGYVIGGVYINSEKNDVQGFFGYLDSSAEIKNLGIVASYIKGKNSIGGLVGRNGYWEEDSVIKGSKINNCYFTGIVIGNYNVGGLVGQNYGLITNSHSAGAVKGVEYVGGLVSFNDSTIANSYSSSIVTGAFDVGGLVGRNWGVIVNSHSKGSVKGENSVGGLVGYFNDKAIINSYSTASVNGGRNVGGLVGMILCGIVSNSYSSGMVKGISRTGGLVGYIGGTGSIINSYSNSLVTGGKNEVNGMIGSNDRKIYSYNFYIEYESVVSRSYYDKQKSERSDKCKYAGKTTAEMKKKTTYAGWDFENIWAINDTINNGYPYLLGSDYIEKYEYIEDARKLDLSRIYRENTCPVEAVVITTAKELANFAKAVNNGKNFLNKTIMLGANIMLNDTANWLNWENEPPKNEWIPIGTKKNKFSGTFNGNGFVISGVYINNSKNEQGLFGVIDTNEIVKDFGLVNGIVKNFGVVASYIKGSDKIGGIAGINLGKIYGCYFTGMAEGINNIGGIAGESAGYIEVSYSAGAVTGANNVGGLAGATFKNEINFSYSTSAVRGTESNIGGLVGSGMNERIVNSYSAGMVTGVEGSTGGLLGILDGESYIIHNYSSSKVNIIGIKEFGGLVGYAKDASYISGNYYVNYDINASKRGYEGKTPAEMKQKATFSGWNFKDTWGISDTINCGYPYLVGFEHNVRCGGE